MSIWFPFLATDWFKLKNPQLKNKAVVLTAPTHGRMVVTKSNDLAETAGIHRGMLLADARSMIQALEVLDDKPGLDEKLLKRIAEWCIRFTPVAAMDLPEGIILDITGCTHLWGGDENYTKHILNRLHERGYYVRAGIADSIGAAWAIARYGKQSRIIDTGEQRNALLELPSAALRLEPETIERLNKLGLRQVKDFLDMPHSALRRRFGDQLIKRLNQALGYEEEIIQPVQPITLYHERLPCIEPIVTAKGIEIALEQLLGLLCHRLQAEQLGLRSACLKCYRVDGKLQSIEIATNSPSHNVKHLFKLFEINIASIEPDLGIELFVLEASKVEDHFPSQQNLWKAITGVNDIVISELIDRLTGKLGSNRIYRFLPDEHYWPERSFRKATSVLDQKTTEWKMDKPRPVQVLAHPEIIEVTAPVPDYPPMLFRYKGKLHKVISADGPERIEQEWWIEEGQHRDYYAVEDEAGHRYWLFRSGHYDDSKTYQWFIHGFFA